MPEDLIKTNVLTICLIGGVLALVGLGLYLAHASVAAYMRYFLPFPPIGVAAYVFAFNYFKDVAQPVPMAGILKEVLKASMVAMTAFFCFSTIVILVISFVRQLSRPI